MNKNEREKLTAIIETEGGNKWWVLEEFEKHIRSQLPTELEIVTSPPASTGNYNCFVYTFGLENDREFLGGQNPIHKEFVRHLMLKNILQVKENPMAGDLVFYEDDSHVITHGGIMWSSKKVISKWMWGCTIKHDLWDAPSSFGDKVFFCSPVETNIIKQAYQDYKDNGVEIMSIQ